MNSTQDPPRPPLQFAEVQSWPLDRVMALTRELADSLPPESRATVAAELINTNAEAPPTGDLASLIGLFSRYGVAVPEGDVDVEALREERLWKKYGPW